MQRVAKLLSIGLAAACVVPLSGAPSGALERSARCPKFKPARPNTPASQADEALEADVVVVGPWATEDDPLVIEYSHGPAFWEFGHRVQEDEVFFNLLALGPKKSGLHVRIDFPAGALNEADLFLYDETGQRVASSATFGLGRDVGLSDPGNGGIGYDYIPGYKASRCDGFTVESRALWGPGGASTLSVWHGPIGSGIPNEDGQEG